MAQVAVPGCVVVAAVLAGTGLAYRKVAEYFDPKKEARYVGGWGQ